MAGQALRPIDETFHHHWRKKKIRCYPDLSLAEASVGVEPTIADLQSAALATWPRRLELNVYLNGHLKACR